ncbi:MAG: LL-diaminopimelate aminotransferase [Pseudomonadota bacterium]
MKRDVRAERIRNLPPYLFAEIDRIKGELRREGVDLIDLSIGDPDLPTPARIIDRLAEAARTASNHRYPSYNGSERFREAVATWYRDRFGVVLDPATEVLALIGSKEGLAHAPLAFLDPGAVALIPSIAYPVYATATAFAGGESVILPVNEGNGYRPDLKSISEEARRKARVLFLNYPNNPTSAVADPDYFVEVAAFAERTGILVLHDAAYSEVCFDGYEPPSFLQAAGGKEVGVEFHSLSKTFNMTGWRVGFAVGNRDAIAALAKVKTNIDSGVFTAIQEASIVALQNWKSLRDANNEIYVRRRKKGTEALRNMGVDYYSSSATFYLWCKVPTKERSAEFCARVLRKSGLVLTPGNGFGEAGEGHFRISLTASEERLEEGLKRFSAFEA